MAQFAIGSLWGDKTPVTTLAKASDAFKVMGKYEHILVDDPSFFMRMGLLEVFEGQKEAGSLTVVADELRFGLMEGRCIDPSRLLFGTQLDHEKVALRLGMGAAATLTQSTSGDERLKAWLNILKIIGERIWG